ncbi:uncharacterized protein N7511_005858 [Penicillium nucicola]|uniref:uncharacterized protein n=1 Tax=Penicillium nucicola TaxID=1850975 RepID=UPI002545616E|nr:uncharacterized protein N7511_005858 [Penicillium nucicola]KAJ5762476.1 hypothetical protein N7511_005858 [Penicillium nucicola]
MASYGGKWRFRPLSVEEKKEVRDRAVQDRKSRDAVRSDLVAHRNFALTPEVTPVRTPIALLGNN